MDVLKIIALCDMVAGVLCLLLIPVLHRGYHMRLLFAATPLAIWAVVTILAVMFLLWILAQGDFG